MNGGRDERDWFYWEFLHAPDLNFGVEVKFSPPILEIIDFFNIYDSILHIVYPTMHLFIFVYRPLVNKLFKRNFNFNFTNLYKNSSQ